METISLFRFPLLIILNVLSRMCPFELVNLSVTNNKIRQYIKYFAKKSLEKKVRIGFGIVSEGFVIRLREWHSIDIWAYRFISEQAKDATTTVFDQKGIYQEVHSIYIHSENTFDDFKKRCEYIKEIFGWEIDGIEYAMDSHPDQNRLIIDWLRRRQRKISFTIRGNAGNDADLKYLLDNFKSTEYLTILSKPKDDFQVNLPQNLKNLHILDANFVNLKQLLSVKCPQILLCRTNLTSLEINSFLKSWIASQSHLDLEYFVIGINLETSNDIFLDINFTIVNAQDAKIFRYPCGKIAVKSGYDIRRNDGRLARLGRSLHRGSNVLKMFIAQA